MLEKRRTHAERVAGLLVRWARGRRMSPLAVDRWAAAGYLHDALRDAPESILRTWAPGDFRGAPPKVLHGPAVANRLRREGVEDEEFLLAIAYHTFGHPRFQDLGKALYCADYLEPARRSRPAWRSELRRRMPDELEWVTREVLKARVSYALERNLPVRPETLSFWNATVATVE
jgi:2-amino-4-hydroxy-6-hydroxymethyldihydropteridine diphosphokinase